MQSDPERPAPAWPVVLDTNVVLDWQLFHDPRGQGLWNALEAGQLRWHATPEMLAELAAVLERPLGANWEPARKRTLPAKYLPWVSLAEAPAHPNCELHCADPDDQPFLDLALQLPARWLVTRDRALLELTQPATSRGLAILPPERWPGC